MQIDFDTWYATHYVIIKQGLDSAQYLSESGKALVLMSHREGAQLAWEYLRNA